MKFVKRSERREARVSLVLLDWGVRESFHLLHYLKQQTVPRDWFEVVLVEYYSGISEPLRRFEEEVDTWLLLEMPEDCYYHKHLMYNAGLVVANGGIVMIGDSDAMVRETFIERIIDRFAADPHMVYHMDQFRNVRRDLYPFNYPTFEAVLGEGCINNVGGLTSGIVEEEDPVHARNFGACMCARRDDLLAIGGSDEDLTYLGHVCGPYDLSFRLMHHSRRLVWETEEYMYHTWHPGSDGVDNYSGPHDGRNMSTTALKALTSGRVKPLVENGAVARLRQGGTVDLDTPEGQALLIAPAYAEAFSRRRLGGAAVKATVTVEAGREPLYAEYKGFSVIRHEDVFYAVPAALGSPDLADPAVRADRRIVSGASFTELKATLDEYEPRLLDSIGTNNIVQVGRRFAVVPQSLGAISFYDPADRANPEIRWAETLAEANAAAHAAAAAPAPTVRATLAAVAASLTPAMPAGGPAEPAAVGRPLASLPARAARRLYRMLAGNAS